jgi:hypothetical protein
MLVVCEPECLGDAHEEVNSAFLYEFSQLLPEDKVVFFADESHVACVKRNLNRKQVFPENIEFRAERIPSHPITDLGKYYEYLEYLKQVFRFAQSRQVSRIVFLSINGYNLRAIKELLKEFNVSCICVLHGFLERLFEKHPLHERIKVWNSIPDQYVRVKSYFLRANRNVTYVVLSPIIRDRLISLYPALASHVEAVHHPYLFEKAEPHIPFKDGKLRLGTSGSLFDSKGRRVLERLISDLLSSDRLRDRFEVIVIGDTVLRGKYPPNIRVPPSPKRLHRDYMYQLAREVDYFLFLYPKHSYELMASGAYFDTLSYAKPVMALKNSFFSYYFELMGNVGFLFDQYEGMKNKLLETMDTLPLEEWKQMQSKIVEDRDKLMTHNHNILQRMLRTQC